MLITKGDLFHQQAKVAASGLSHHFAAVEIVAEKDPSDYLGVLARHGVAADEFIMVGNSLRSDVLPVLEIGGGAVYIPYEVTWALEVADLGDKVTHRLVQIDSMRQLRGAVDQLIS